MKTDRFSEMGIASLLPGMRYMLDQMQEQIKYMEQALAAHQENREQGSDSDRGEFAEPKRRGRPGSNKKKSSWVGMTAAQRSAEMRRRQAVARGRRKARLGPVRQSKGKSWAGMTAEQRSIEMRRRQAISRTKLLAQAGAAHPRDPRHPGHAAWLAKISKANKKTWESMSAAQRKQRIKRMMERRPAARTEALVNGAA